MTLRERLVRQGPSMVLIAMTVGFVVASYQYPPASRELPLLVGWTTLIMLVIEFVSQGESRLGRVLQSFLAGKGGDQPSVDIKPTGTVSREIGAFVWVICVTAAVMLFGFYLTIPVYVAGFLRFRARTSLPVALMAGLGLTGFIYVLFEILMGYRLFYGFVFGDF